MIKVGFVVNLTNDWLGGINYYRNLLDAIYHAPERQIEPVLITGKNNKVNLGMEFSGIRIVKTGLLDPLTFPWFFRKLTAIILGYDHCLEKILKENGVEVLSHAASLKTGFSLPVVGWVPDLQHKYFPQLFSKRELDLRDNSISQICKRSVLIIVSSRESEKDLMRLFPESRGKIRILHFTVKIPRMDEPVDPETVKKKYGISKPYFLVANQFWTHKNHKVIIDALGRMSGEKGRFQVVATGSTRDYRDGRYFSQLMDYAAGKKVLEEFVVTGIIPYADLIILMKHSLALINPSNFEGWNTAVEEASALGKKIILSDIPVHREQNPDRGIFFQPDDAGRLLDCMLQAAAGYNSKEEEMSGQSALSVWRKFRLEFAEKYQAIILEALDASHQTKNDK